MDEFVALFGTRPLWFKVFAFTSLVEASNIVSIYACLKEPTKLVVFYSLDLSKVYDFKFRIFVCPNF